MTATLQEIVQVEATGRTLCFERVTQHIVASSVVERLEVCYGFHRLVSRIANQE